MRSLEIRTERIFNNLIKQNQKLAADFVRPVSRVQSPSPWAWQPTSRVQRLEFRVQRPASRVPHPESSVQSPASRVQRPESSVQSPESSIQSPESSFQNPASRVQSPASNSCVQNTGIPVCRSRDMLNFNFSEKGLGLVSPPHFVRDYSRQMFLMLHSIKGTLMQIGKSQYMSVFV